MRKIVLQRVLTSADEDRQVKSDAHLSELCRRGPCRHQCPLTLQGLSLAATDSVLPWETQADLLRGS